ncbi:MAG: hypothetical protein ACLRVU_03410 [Beduini sp.]|uniref:hypothetical protein n=1 Tax=Beduini sp. TaxID=1922300 RepID=UPI00399F0AFC
MKLIKTSQKAPIQAVTETTLESNSNINAPTIKAVVDNLYRPNLLVNGDFQCNQRGLSSYMSAGNTIYTVDMWRINKMSLTVENDGITITNTDTTTHGLVQILNNPLTNGKYTATVKVALVTGDVLLYGVKKLESGINIFTFDSAIVSKDRLNIDVQPNSSVKLIYCDLFEGTIAYPHIKEDYTVALMRCQRYVIFYDGIYADSNITASNKAKNDLLNFNMWLPSDLSGATTSIEAAIAYAGGTQFNYTLKTFSTEALKNRVRLRFKKTDETSFPIETDTEYSVSIRNLLITKEPL